MASIPVDGRLRSASAPSVTPRSLAGGTLPSRKRFTVADGPRLSQYTNNGASDLNGVVDVTIPFQAALADAAVVAVGAYGNSKGCPVLLDEGIAMVSGKLTIGQGVGIRGAGCSASVITIPNAPFADNCIISNLTQDTTQEFAFIEKLSMFGRSNLGVVQANAGSATTFMGTTFEVTDPSIPITLQVGSTAGYASNGTLSVGGSRWIYQSVVDTTHFGGCVLMSAAGVTITNGAAVTAVTTNNLVGIQLVNVFGGSYLRDLWVSNYTGEGIAILGRTNGFPFDNINAVHTNRDCILFSGHPQVMNFETVLGAYSGENGSTDGDTAGLHILGSTDSTTASYQGGITIGNLYSEQNAVNASALWLQNVGGVSADAVRLEGGTTNQSTQMAVRIDSVQASPLTQDTAHSANISLRNISSTQVGRKTLVDNVRGLSTPANTADRGLVITRYDTEDSSPGVVLPFAANTLYWTNQLVLQAGVMYQRVATGVSGASFAADIAHWVSFASQQDRLDALRKGTVASYRESWDRRSGGTQAFAYTSGLLEAAVVPVLLGDSFTKVIFETHTTGATLGTNGDSHWYLAVYDDATGNLIVQTADQGATAIPASTIFSIALQSTYTPTADAMIRIALMIYLGTGGTPVAPTLRASIPPSGGAIVVGMARQAVSGTGSLTTGIAPGTFGAVANLGNIPYFALSSS